MSAPRSQCECDNCQYGDITDPCLSPRYDDETEIDMQDERDENAEFGGIEMKDAQ